MYFQRFSGSTGQPWLLRGLRRSKPSGDEEEEDTRALEVRISRSGSTDSETFGSCAVAALKSGMRGCELKSGGDLGVER